VIDKLKRFLVNFLLVIAGLVEIIGIIFITRFPYGVNLELISGNPHDFYWNPEDKNVNFRFENPNLPEIKWLRKRLIPVVKNKKSDLERAVAIRKWTRAQIKFGTPEKDSDWNPIKILENAKKGVTYLCDEYAALFGVASYSVGLYARVLFVKKNKQAGHFLNEVWLKEYQKWAIIDPLFNCIVVNAETFTPLSALEIHNGEKEDFMVLRQGSETEPDPLKRNYLDYFRSFTLVLSNDFISRPQNFFFLLLKGPRKFLLYSNDKNILKPMHFERDRKKLRVKVFLLVLNALFILILALLYSKWSRERCVEFAA